MPLVCTLYFFFQNGNEENLFKIKCCDSQNVYLVTDTKRMCSWKSVTNYMRSIDLKITVTVSRIYLYLLGMSLFVYLGECKLNRDVCLNNLV